MTAPQTLNDKVRDYSTLVTTIGDLGIEVSDEVQAEVSIYNNRRETRRLAQSKYDSSIQMLELVAPADFESARSDMIAASLELAAVSMPENEKHLDSACAGRLMH